MEFAVFHVTHRENRASIRKTGLLSRSAIRGKNLVFEDLADGRLKAQLSLSQHMQCLSPTGQGRDISFTPAEFVPCHFLKPLHRDDILPADVYRWRANGMPLDACVIKRDFVQGRKHLVCIGHWKDKRFGGPILLESIRLFVSLLGGKPAKVLSCHPYMEKFFSDDIPNILAGRVKGGFLGYGRYRHLISSSVFVEDRVPPHQMKIVELESLSAVATEEDYIFGL